MTDSSARRLRDALEPLAALSFHSEPAQAAYAELGLPEFAHRYFWSRSSPMGEPVPAVVHAAFGVWPYGFVRDGLTTGRARCPLDAIRTATDSGSGEAVKLALADTSDANIDDVTAVLRRGIDAAPATARPLFAANRALPAADDPHTRLWRAATAWRELRGDSHLAACAAHGVAGLDANILNELDAGFDLGEYTATRTWTDDNIARAADGLRDRGLLDGDALSSAGRQLRVDIEDATDIAVAPAVDAVGNDLDRVVEQANRWSRSVVERGWFPDDGRKRRAG